MQPLDRPLSCDGIIAAPISDSPWSDGKFLLTGRITILLRHCYVRLGHSNHMNSFTSIQDRERVTPLESNRVVGL